MSTGLDDWKDEQEQQQAEEERREEENQRNNWSDSYGQWGIPYIDPDDDEFASKLQAALTRAQWETWKSKFKPVYEELVGTIGNPEVHREQIARATDVTQRSFDATRSDMDRRRSRYGVGMDDTTRQATETNLGLSRAASTAAARNSTRNDIENREMQLMVGGLSGIGSLREDE